MEGGRDISKEVAGSESRGSPLVGMAVATSLEWLRVRRTGGELAPALLVPISLPLGDRRGDSREPERVVVLGGLDIEDVSIGSRDDFLEFFLTGSVVGRMG